MRYLILFLGPLLILALLGSFYIDYISVALVQLLVLVVGLIALAIHLELERRQW